MFFFKASLIILKKHLKTKIEIVDMLKAVMAPLARDIGVAITENNITANGKDGTPNARQTCYIRNSIVAITTNRQIAATIKRRMFSQITYGVRRLFGSSLPNSMSIY